MQSTCILLLSVLMLTLHITSYIVLTVIDCCADSPMLSSMYFRSSSVIVGWAAGLS